MDYSRLPLADALANAYVLGTLRGAARQRFEALLPAHPALRHAVWQWQARLAPLSQSVPPRQPPARVWQNIERRLFGDAARSTHFGFWASLRQNLGFWQGFAGLASGVAILGFLLHSTASQAPTTLLLASSTGAQPFIVSLNADGYSLTLTPVAAHSVPVTVGKSLQLWALPKTGAPQSLGVMAGNSTLQVQQSRFKGTLASNAAFAVSVEPLGGSPTGLPTGEVIASGKLY